MLDQSSDAPDLRRFCQDLIAAPEHSTLLSLQMVACAGPAGGCSGAPLLSGPYREAGETVLLGASGAGEDARGEEREGSKEKRMEE